MGVFQGSGLGPLLFSIFSVTTYHYTYAGDAEVFQYADDTQVLVSGPARDLEVLISCMEDLLASLNDWFSANALKVNASKTQLIVFGSRQNPRKLPDVRVSFRDAALQPCTQVGTLASLLIALPWDAHVSELCRQCTGLLVGLSHARHCLPDGITRMLVTALVVSRIRYCLSGYGNGSPQKIDRLKKN